MILAGAGLTATLKSTPASAELVPMDPALLLLRLTSVRRPITADGRMTNTLPFPLFWAKAALLAPSAAMRRATARTTADFFIRGPSLGKGTRSMRADWEDRL